MSLSRRDFLKSPAAVGLSGVVGLGPTAARGAAQPAATPRIPEGPADTILVNGKIVTVDRSFSIAEAAAIKNGVFMAVGTSVAIRSLAGPRTATIDLAGKTVLPGLIDGHPHMDKEGLKYLYPSLGGARSIDDILKIIEREVRKAKPGDWIVTMPVGDPWDYQNVPGILKEKRFPTRWDLDKVSPNNPVYIRSPDGRWSHDLPFYSVVNSYALKVAGITKDTPPAWSGMTIYKDPTTGEPTGVFSENAYVTTLDFTLLKMAPYFTHADRVKALRDSVRRYNAVGTTSMFEGHGVSSEVFRAYREVWASGDLTVRSYLVMSPTPGKSVAELDEMMRDWGTMADGRGVGDGTLTFGGIFIQGPDNDPTSAIRVKVAPYTSWQGFYKDVVDPAKFRGMVQSAARYNLRVATTAGQGGQVLDLLEEINRTTPIRDRRWVAVHVGVASAKNIERMKALGLVATVIGRGTFYPQGGRRFREVSAELRDDFSPYKRMAEAGLPVVISTDNVPPSLFESLWSAIARKTGDTGETIGPSQRLTREQALRMVTANGAYLTFEENIKGSIEPGKYADLIILRENYLTVPEDQIRDIRVLTTMVGGKIVYQNDKA